MRATMNVLRQRPTGPHMHHPPLDAADLIHCATEHGRRFTEKPNAFDFNFFSQACRFTYAWFGEDAARKLWKMAHDNVGKPLPNPFDPHGAFRLRKRDYTPDVHYNRAQREEEDRLSWGDGCYYPGVVKIDYEGNVLSAREDAFPDAVRCRGNYDKNGEPIITEYVYSPEYRDERDMWLDAGDAITGPPEHTRKELEALRAECQQAARDLAKLNKRDFDYGFQHEYVAHLKSYITDLYGQSIYDLFLHPNPDAPDPIDTCRMTRQWREEDRTKNLVFHPETRRKHRALGPWTEHYAPNQPAPYEHIATQLTGIRVADRGRDTESYTAMTELRLLDQQHGHATSYDRTLGLRDDIAFSRKVRRVRQGRTALHHITAQYNWKNAISPSMTMDDVIAVAHLASFHDQVHPVLTTMCETFGDAAGLALLDHALSTPWTCAI